MAKPSDIRSIQELAKSREATLRALAYCHSQLTAVAEHITCIEQKIDRLQLAQQPSRGDHRT